MMCVCGWGGGGVLKTLDVLGQTTAIIILSLNKQMVTVIFAGLTLMDFQ